MDGSGSADSASGGVDTKLEDRRKSARIDGAGGVEEDDEPQPKFARIDANGDSEEEDSDFSEEEIDPPAMGRARLSVAPSQEAVDRYFWDTCLNAKLQFWDHLQDFNIAEMKIPAPLFWDTYPQQIRDVASKWDKLSRHGALYKLAQLKVLKDRATREWDNVRILSMELMISTNPYIKGTDDLDEAFEYFRDFYKDSYSEEEVRAAVQFCVTTLEIMEPVFHPVIRAARITFLFTLCTIKRKQDHWHHSESFEPSPEYFTFFNHCGSPTDASRLIMGKLEACEDYQIALNKIVLLCEFGDYLTSAEGIKYWMGVDSAKDVARVGFKKFDELDSDLMMRILKARLQLLEWLHNLDDYADCMTRLWDDHKKEGPMANEFRSIIEKLDGESFFSMRHLEFLNKRFVQVLPHMGIFSRLPTAYAVQGLVVYKKILDSTSDAEAFQAFRGDLAYLGCKARNLLELWNMIKLPESVPYRICTLPLSTLKWNASSEAFERSTAREELVKTKLYLFELPPEKYCDFRRFQPSSESSEEDDLVFEDFKLYYGELPSAYSADQTTWEENFPSF